jgi:hypothetical protein
VNHDLGGIITALYGEQLLHGFVLFLAALVGVKRLAQGEDSSSALRDAKLDLLSKYGEQVSPFYWAAFITVGETSTPIGIKQQ